MDPLTAFSLTCGVIQVVDFATKFTMKCRELYRDGTFSENKEIESMSKHLTDLVMDLGLPSGVQTSGSKLQLYHDDQELLQLAQQCSDTANFLVDELHKLSLQGQHRKRDTLRKAVKNMRKSHAIEDIERRLERCRTTLDTRILVTLRQQIHLVVNEQSKGFQELDRSLQNLIIGLTSGSKTFDQLKHLIKAENASSQQHTSQEFQNHRELLATQDFYERLLESLSFPDMRARQESIEEAHKETFGWVFDSSTCKTRAWHSFIDWLEHGHGIYWISGKAGSGKSTLLNFICHDSRTETALRIWSRTDEIFMPNFFFWSPGTQLQKSLAGLLRSLVYQLVGRFPDSASVLAKSIGSSQHGLHQFPTWTEQRLRSMLHSFLSDELKGCHLCIFIDGLDEFQGNQASLLRLVRSLERSTSVKFCLSSRPDQLFKDELGTSAMMRLQDLTEPDIRRYVTDELDQASLKCLQVPDHSFRLINVINRVIEKAEGVFLWVKLAVRDQIEGITDRDDAEQLERRLEALPVEIEALYGHMLGKIHRQHSKEAAQYLQLVLQIGMPSLFGVALAAHERIDDILLLSPSIPILDVRLHCEWVEHRIATTCRGLLEVREDRERRRWRKGVEKNDPTDLLPMRKVRVPLEQLDNSTLFKMYQDEIYVSFLHRTAFDFFRDNERGKKFLEMNTAANPHPRLLYTEASTAKIVVFGFLNMSHISVVEPMMDEARLAEKEMGTAQPALMDLINRSLTLLYERSTMRPLDRHWCRGYRLRNHHHARFSTVMDDVDFSHLDFLGLAAVCGIVKYVEHILDSQSMSRKSNTLKFLINCFLDSFRTEIIPLEEEYLELILGLLRRGANPNFNGFLGLNVWGVLLEKLWFLENRFEDRSSSRLCPWANVVLECLKNGADLDKRVYCQLRERSTDVTHLASSRSIISTSYTFTLRLSARCVLQECFAGHPGSSEIEEILTASNAPLSVQCLEVSCLVKDRERNGMIIFELSEKELQELQNRFEQHLETSKQNYEKRHRKFDRQFNRLFQGLNVEKILEKKPRR